MTSLILILSKPLIVAGITNRGGEGGCFHRHSRCQRRPSPLKEPPPPNPSYHCRRSHRGCHWRSVINAAATELL
ncbi:hypothetical protein AHAS_Ahas06G0169900 [Arachis hypogaea]